MWCSGVQNAGNMRESTDGELFTQCRGLLGVEGRELVKIKLIARMCGRAQSHWL